MLPSACLYLHIINPHHLDNYMINWQWFWMSNSHFYYTFCPHLSVLCPHYTIYVPTPPSRFVLVKSTPAWKTAILQMQPLLLINKIMMLMIFTMSRSVGLSTSWRIRTLTAVVGCGITLLSTGGAKPFRQHKRFSLFSCLEFLVFGPRVPFDLFVTFWPEHTDTHTHNVTCVWAFYSPHTSYYYSVIPQYTTYEESFKLIKEARTQGMVCHTAYFSR